MLISLTYYYGLYIGEPRYSSVLPIIHHDEYACPWPTNHRFKMAKFTKLMEYLLKENIVLPKQVVQPMKASYDDLITTHTPQYVKSVMNGTIEQHEMRQTGFSWSRGLANRCLAEVGKNNTMHTSLHTQLTLTGFLQTLRVLVDRYQVGVCVSPHLSI